MPNSEIVDYSQESQEKSQELLASQKFDEIFNKIWGVLSYKNDKGEKIIIGTSSSNSEKIISIEKNGKITYRLDNQNGKFTLNYWPNLENVIEDVTSDELLNNILPNFEKRLNEWETLRAQERQKALEDSNQYAYQQDQQDADRLLQENGLA